MLLGPRQSECSGASEIETCVGMPGRGVVDRKEGSSPRVGYFKTEIGMKYDWEPTSETS